ncbi:TspO/MBR family protein [Flavisphingomonas formosensis]|uniref:TspO/MBR family protein n=1 Tax=Flavisphingomonas formosensis TaxID=861534 RepID=UPI0012F79044|nr:TspO/MBR family protein [Sphingomonas formosensis]
MGEIASPGQLRMSFLRRALFVIPLICLIGIGSGRLANSGYGNPWFAMLVKPAMTPPGWVFGLVWTILYVMMGLALAIILNARRAPGRGVAIAVFLIQLLLNFAWSPLFFAAHKVTAALALLLLLIVLAGCAIGLFWRIRASAGLLLIPYFFWLCFAAMLTFQIDKLNPDAERLAPGGPRAQIQL